MRRMLNKMTNEGKIKYRVIEKRHEAPNVETLVLSTIDNRVLQYCAGQFINIYFPEINVPEGKAYSVSRILNDKTFEITIKAMGEFSNRLCDLHVGDLILASLPYGFFYSETEDSRLVMLAAGIGVTPFRAMIYELLEKYSETHQKMSQPGGQREMFLFYSSRTEADIIFKNEFDRLKSEYKNFKISYFLTREKKVLSGIENSRITADKILENISSVKNTEFLLCGSIAFVRDMRISLRSKRVPEEAIYTEAFFSH